MSEALLEQLGLVPERLAGHLFLTLAALASGLALSVPLMLLCLRVRGLQGPLLATAGVIQTVPGLALLALMVPLLGQIGFAPAFCALVLYSILPILRNAVTGIREVDPAAVEAGRALGMTANQLLIKVQLPLALPVIIAGIRTATVWVVGMATLSTPVGYESLGDFIFRGLQLMDSTQVLVGCVAAASLAVVLDLLIRLAEMAAQKREPLFALGAGAGLMALLGIGLSPMITGGRASILVGAKTFTEQYILAELIADRLAAAGISADSLNSLGSTVVFDALVQGNIHCYVDYTGTIWANHMKRTDNPGAAQVLAEVTQWLDREHGITCLGALGFENAYALAMRRDHAEALGVSTIADLAAHAPRLVLGGDYEFFGRPEWPAVRDAYGLRFDDTTSFDSTLMYGAVESGDVDVISAFSTDGRIAAFDLVVLEDTRQVLPPYDAVLLLSTAADAVGIRGVLQGLIGSIDNEAMRRANKMVDVDKRTVKDAAAFLRRQAP